MSTQERNIEQLLEIEDMKKLRRGMFVEIKVSKKNLGYFIVSLVVSIFISYLISFSYETIKNFLKCIEMLNNVEVAFISIVFTGYSLFQALVGDGLLRVMSNTENNFIYMSNKSFLNLMLLYIYIIILNIVLIIFLNLIPSNALVFDNVLASNIMCCCMIFVYFLYTFMILKELETFSINLYRMFNSYNAYRMIDKMNKDIYTTEAEDKND